MKEKKANWQSYRRNGLELRELGIKEKKSIRVKGINKERKEIN